LLLNYVHYYRIHSINFFKNFNKKIVSNILSNANVTKNFFIEI